MQGENCRLLLIKHVYCLYDHYACFLYRHLIKIKMYVMKLMMTTVMRNLVISDSINN